MTATFRSLPSMDRLLSDPRLKILSQQFTRESVAVITRSQLNDIRKDISKGEGTPNCEDIVKSIELRIQKEWCSSPKFVINATGVILHTNLGRAPLSYESNIAIQKVLAGYSDLELDLNKGTRGSRQTFVSNLLCQLTGAESALVVNNNAAAVLLGLSALANDKEVLVSRGQAIEIGGGFRIPELLQQTKAKLVEVGTTNRTYIEDYANAINDKTAAILSIHTSNFKVTGFTHSPKIDELAALGTKHGIPVLDDLGSGCLLDTSQFNLAHEVMPHESLKAGVELVFFSGDKLMGGPQAGLIIGKQKLIQMLSSHPLARAVRIDKSSIAALSATLIHYIKGEALEKIPVWQMISTKLDELKIRADRWAELDRDRIEVVKGQSTIGGGSLPGETLPSWLISIDTSMTKGGAELLLTRLRHSDPPIIGRIDNEQVILDPRTVSSSDDKNVFDTLNTIFNKEEQK